MAPVPGNGLWSPPAAPWQNTDIKGKCSAAYPGHPLSGQAELTGNLQAWREGLLWISLDICRLEKLQFRLQQMKTRTGSQANLCRLGLRRKRSIARSRIPGRARPGMRSGSRLPSAAAERPSIDPNARAGPRMARRSVHEDKMARMAGTYP